MDQARFEQLKKKRFETGLSDEEANELGRLFAEQKGVGYESADEFQADERKEEAVALAGERSDKEADLRMDPEAMKAAAEGRAGPSVDRGGGTIGVMAQESEEVEEE